MNKAELTRQYVDLTTSTWSATLNQKKTLYRQYFNLMNKTELQNAINKWLVCNA